MIFLCFDEQDPGVEWALRAADSRVTVDICGNHEQPIPRQTSVQYNVVLGRYCRRQRTSEGYFPGTESSWESEGRENLLARALKACHVLLWLKMSAV